MHKLRVFQRNFDISKMFSSITQAVRNERVILTVFCAVSLVYFAVMDTTFYFAMQTHTLMETPEPGTGYSPFSPLSIKLLLTNYLEHYIISPTAEYFDSITRFSKVFYFITPNMITLTHFIIAIGCGRLAYSDSLYHRRIAVILFELRAWLDSLDGVVYRSHAGERTYTSNRNQWGYVADCVADMCGGIFFCTGLWWYFTKTVKPQTDQLDNSWKKSLEEGLQNGAVERHPIVKKYSKKYLYWIIWKFGGLILMSSAAWTMTTEQYEKVFQVALADQSKQVLQLDLLRSNTTWLIFWLWRMLEGQMLLHVIAFVTYIDKVWEFVNFIPIYGLSAFVALNILTQAHIHQMHVYLDI